MKLGDDPKIMFNQYRPTSCVFDFSKVCCSDSYFSTKIKLKYDQRCWVCVKECSSAIKERNLSQLTFTSSKSTIETVEKGVKCD